MGMTSSKATSASPLGGMAKRGNSGSQRRRKAPTSPDLGLSSGSYGGLKEMVVIDLEGNENDNMVCDPPGTVVATNSITEKQENYTPGTLNAASTEKEAIAIPVPAAPTSSWPLSNQQYLGEADFTKYVASLLKFSSSSPAGVGDNDIPDTVRFALISVVQYLQSHNAEHTRATSLERAGLMEAHRAEKCQLVAESEERVAEVQRVSEVKMQELNCRLEKVSKENSDALCQLRGVQTTLSISQKELQDCKERVIKQLQGDLKEKTDLIEKLNAAQNAKAAEMQRLKDELEKKLRHSQEATEVSDKEVQRLKINIEEKGKVVEDMNSERSQLMTKCQKLEAQLAVIEQKTAQESLSSGSYADDHANPSILQEFACRSVDKATEALAKFLHDNSITKSCPQNSEGLKHFLFQISHASPEVFSRTLHVKYTWSHWICFIMFHGFEHVFYDLGNGLITSPLDAKQHTSTCFQSFHQKKDMSSSALYEECHMFNLFCKMKYANVFPRWLVQEALHLNSPNDTPFNDFGRFNGDEEIYNRFLDVAKAVWLLHHLAFSFDPPATILRMALGEPFDKQFHESVIHDGEKDGSSKVVLMVRPAFRVRNTIIRSRVFLSMKS